MGVDHYENFPVASWLCPPALRPPIVAIYRFARTADDIADEGDATADERLADLAAYRADLDAAARRTARPPRAGPDVFEPLARAIARHRLPVAAARGSARRLRAGRRQAALRRPRRAARLLPPLGQSDRPAAAAPLRHRRRRPRCAAPTRSAPRCSSPTSGRTSASTRRAAGSTCPRPTARRHGVDLADVLARRDSAAPARPRRSSSSPGRAS